MNVLHGFQYLHKSLILLVALLLIVVMLGMGTIPKVLNAETVITGGLLFAILLLLERYRQRFYLDWKRERGFHWRAGLLQFAKWPYLIMAFFDVMFDRRFPYVITSKIPGTTRTSLALWPHILILFFIGLAWLIGLSLHETIPIEVQICAGAVMMTILVLLATEFHGVFRSTLKHRTAEP